MTNGKELSNIVQQVPDTVQKRWDTWIKNMEGKNKFKEECQPM